MLSESSASTGIDPDCRPVQSPDALAQELDGETVIMDMASESYFGLNEAGTEIWNLLDGTRTPAEIAARLADVYDAPVETLQRDCITLLTTLREAGLVQLATDDADP